MEKQNNRKMENRKVGKLKHKDKENRNIEKQIREIGRQKIEIQIIGS